MKRTIKFIAVLLTIIIITGCNEAAKTKLSLARLALQAGKSVNRKEIDQAIQTFQKLGAQVDLAGALQIEDEL